MDVELSGSQLPRSRQLARVTIILVGLVGLIAFYPLMGCAGGGGTSGISTKATAVSKNQPSSWKLVWNDEFSQPAGTPLDQSKWTPDVGDNGQSAKQLEFDTDNQNAYQDGQGNLILEVRKDNAQQFQCWYGPCQYTSARISTRGHFSFAYGLLVARIKTSYGQGLWSGFWLLGSNFATVGWPACGEIDVMENIGQKESATIHGSVHGPGNASDSYTLFTRSYTLPHGAFADGFHVFTLQWDPSHLYFFVDGINYATFNKATLTNQQDWVYRHPFDIILDVAVGGDWSGNPASTTVFPQRMYVSYVRLYKDK